jgi:hypothetical protein
MGTLFFLTFLTESAIRLNHLLATAGSIAMTPNPARDQVSFLIPSIFAIKKIDIYGVDGQLYRSITVDNEKIIVDTNSLKNGMYIVKFTDENSISKQTTKLFINK